MINILFDLFSSQPVGSIKYHGGGEYIKSVYQHLVAYNKIEIELTVCWNQNIFIDDWIVDSFTMHNVTVIHVDSINILHHWVSDKEFDIFFAGLPYLIDRSYFSYKTKVIGVVHGLRLIEMPCDKYASKYGRLERRAIEYVKQMLYSIYPSYMHNNSISKYKRTIYNFDRIICDSYHTKYSILYHYGEVENANIAVLYPPAKYVDQAEQEYAPLVDGSYILLLGGDRWIKNAYRVLLALDNLYNHNLMAVKTVVVGIPPSSLYKKLEKHKLFHFFDYVKPIELESLYANCELFVFPSLNEGFGLPPIEAMRYGKTCVVSAISSIQELCGNAAYYFNPYSIHEIGTRIIQAYRNKLPPDIPMSNYKTIHKKQDDDLNILIDYLVRGVELIAR